MKKIPKIAAIHDMSGIGRCSMTVIMPIMSALGAQVCPLPTALLSNHSEYPYFYFYDFTDHMKEYYENWEKNNAGFDCLYSGFIGSENQIDIILDIINKVKQKTNALIVVDPVMGDHGIKYKTYTDEMIKKMSMLVKKADIITPNLTEVSILLKEEYPKDKLSKEKLKEYLNKLSSMGPNIVMITGVITDENENINICYDKKNNSYWKVPFEFIDKRYPGTGDLFTSLFLGYFLNKNSLPESIERAGKFVSLAVKNTSKYQTPRSDGVIFENIMIDLYNKIDRYDYTSI